MTTRRDLIKLTAMAVPASMTGGALVRSRASAQESELSGSLTLWHGWTGAEADTLNNDVLPAWLAAHPDATVEALAVPFDQLKAKYNTEAATGGGPDLLIGPLDWVGELATSETIRPLGDLVDPEILGNYLPATVEALTYDEQLYGVPESFETVALYYNTDLVPTPPKTTAELDAIAAGMPEGTYGIALYSNFYHPAGYLFGYGAQLFDAENNSALNSPETVAFLDWMKSATTKLGYFQQNDDAAITSLFKEGKAAMVINGPWALGDYQAALTPEKVGVAPLPAISEAGDAPAKPFLGVKHIMLNANADDERSALAVAFMTWFTGPDGETPLAEKAGHLPAHTGVDVSADPIAQAFVAQAETATPLPTVAEMGQVWEPAQQMITEVLAGEATPEEAAAEAQDTINQNIETMRQDA